MNELIIALLAVAGFVVSWYIHHKKRRNEKLNCVIGKNCDIVVKSKFSTVFGIHLEVFGMIYYAAVILFVVMRYAGVSIMFGFDLYVISTMLAGIAGGVSLILVFIQAFILKEWCEYCLVSAVASILIFIAFII
jgi:uncharacterized membrane protein